MLKQILNTLATSLTFFSWFFAKDSKQIVIEDLNNEKIYVLTATRRLGLFGFGMYSSSPIIQITEQELKTIRQTMADYMRYSSVLITGTKSSILKSVKGVGVMDFGDAPTVQQFMTEQAMESLRTSISRFNNPQAIFINWLKIQISKGTISTIDGYFFNKTDARAKGESITAPEDFLPMYYNSYMAAAKAFKLTSYPSIDVFARELLFRTTALSMGLTENTKMGDIFPRCNEMLRRQTDTPTLELIELPEVRLMQQHQSANNSLNAELARPIG